MNTNREVVKELLNEHKLYKAPVDIVKLANDLGFTVFQQEIDYDGAILARKEAFVIDNNEYNKAIIININQIPTRKRFTIAHEIAHWLMADETHRENLYAHRDDNLFSGWGESDVNSLASELLMPHELVQKVVSEKECKNFISPSMIYAIVKKFNVSYAAAQVRLQKFAEGH